MDDEKFTLLHSRGMKTKRQTDAIYSKWFNGKDGVIVHPENRRRDNDPPDSWPSDVIWRSFLMAAEKEQSSHSHLLLNSRRTAATQRIWIQQSTPNIFQRMETSRMNSAADAKTSARPYFGSFRKRGNGCENVSIGVQRKQIIPQERNQHGHPLFHDWSTPDNLIVQS